MNQKVPNILVPNDGDDWSTSSSVVRSPISMSTLLLIAENSNNVDVTSRRRPATIQSVESKKHIIERSK